MSSNKISGKELVAAFLHPRETPNGSVWLCRCGKKCQQKGSGYTNLALQAENRTVLDVRDLFDEVIKTYPQTKNRLASIIHDNVFEIAVQKILKGSEEELTPDESVKVTGLRHGSSMLDSR
ncbi:hypothetical protein IV203_006429 [Nitzschia inconspicua]|uniref:Uncharacterized protein n=1 Tax=Nitzschia inconspicua TaxID=303405 RepID=A0A9K3KAG7_9STRA|nr:hypothetical protein IV203_006429 [Nitzschia inconspicua]